VTRGKVKDSKWKGKTNQLLRKSEWESEGGRRENAVWISFHLLIGQSTTRADVEKKIRKEDQK